jgi:hypothetical protein
VAEIAQAMLAALVWPIRAGRLDRVAKVYFSWLEMLLNVLFSDVPIEFTAATMTIEIPAAMIAYSITVAPLRSLTKRRTSFLIGILPRNLSARSS